MIKRFTPALALALLAVACASGSSVTAPSAQRREDVVAAAQEVSHGRLERPDGLRLLRLWGTPEERGFAHGLLLADDIVSSLRSEFATQFAKAPQLLQQARAALPRLIEYPEDFVRELDALWRGVLEAGPDRHMPAFGRAFDKVDLLVANAMDVFGLMGCSSFTVWGEQAVGGGVLTARNFDWHITGDHIIEQTLLIVQEHDDGRSTASLGWPGYIGTVSGVSADGVAAYLHVGSARQAMPEPSSWPAATAARKILESRGRGDARIGEAREHVEYTSPPSGFLTHVVLPAVPESGVPAALFEADSRKSVLGDVRSGPCVVTNHFLTRKDGRDAAADSRRRERMLRRGIAGCFELGDQKVDSAEAWDMLREVAVSSRSRFGTLHSLVFRHEPWCFEVAICEKDGRQVVGAPSSSLRYRLTREQVFGAR